MSESSAPATHLGILLAMTFTTGIVDAASFLALGHVFTANMTGNIVLLGFALGGAAGLSAPRSLVGALAPSRHDRIASNSAASPRFLGSL